MIESTRAATISAKPAGEIQQRRLKESCQDFEAVLINFLFKNMRANVLRAEEADKTTELYESMMDEAVARQMSRQEQLGLSQTLYEALGPKGARGPLKMRPETLDSREMDPQPISSVSEKEKVEP